MSVLFERKLTTGWFRSYGEKPTFPMYHVHQVHSAIVLPIETAQLSEQKADGLVTKSPATLAIKTADCLPVAIIGQQGTALLHAGWRGLADGILTAREVTAIAPLEVFIGPCIRSCCFEVTAEFAGHFPHSQLIKRPDGSLRFDLVAEAYRQLKAAFPSAQVSDAGECTCCTMKYPSFRRDKTAQRIWNLFIPLAQ